MTDDIQSRFMEHAMSLSIYMTALDKFSAPKDAESLADPMNAIGDLAALCRAHTTKLGVAFRPPVEIDVAMTTLDKWMELPMPFVSCYSCLVVQSNNDVKDPVITKVRIRLREIFEQYQVLMPLLESAVRIDGDVKTSNEEVLRAIGHIWANCDKLKTIASGDYGDIAAEDLTTYVEFAKDGQKELENDQADLKDQSLYDRTSECVNLIIILWNAVIKRRCKNKETISNAEKLQNCMKISWEISSLVDDLICEVCEGEDVEEIFEKIDQKTKELIETVRKNKKNENDDFTEWINQFEMNYDEKMTKKRQRNGEN